MSRPRCTATVAWLVRAVLALLVLVLPARALAWVEMHVARDDIRVHVDREGKARLEHKVLLLVSGGPLKSFTIRGVDPDAVIDDGAYLVLEKDDKAGSIENAIPLTIQRVAEQTPPRTDLVVEIDGGKGVSRGRYIAVIRYRTDLVAQGVLRIEGTSARIDWVGPSWDDGLDTTRAWFHLPSAPTEPVAAEPGDDDDAAGEYTFLSNLSRRPDSDVLEMVRPYASRGERVVWSLRVDQTAFDLGQGAGTAPAADPTSKGHDARAPIRLVSSARDTMLLLGALALFIIIASLVAAHAIEVRQRAARRDQKARPLLPIPVAVRAILAAIAFVAGVWLQLDRPTSLLGSSLVAATVIFVWHRPVVHKASLRGPGAWLCVRVEEAFAAARPRARGVFEPTSLVGAGVLLLVIIVFAVAGRMVADRSVYHGILIGLDAIPLLALFLTGRESSLAPDAAVDSVPTLASIVRRVERASKWPVRVIPRVRIPNGEPDADELRIVFLPRDPVRGLRAIEVAVAFAPGPGGYVALPEVLVRFDEGSACDELVQHLEPFGRVQRGRRLEERVLAFVPKLPTAALTADLVVAIVERTAVPGRAPKPPVSAPTKTRRAPARAAKQAVVEPVAEELA